MKSSSAESSYESLSYGLVAARKGAVVGGDEIAAACCALAPLNCEVVDRRNAFQPSPSAALTAGIGIVVRGDDSVGRRNGMTKRRKR